MKRTSQRLHESLERRLMLAAQLIKDVDPSGNVNDDPPVLFQLNASTALFVHDDGASGDELWKTNGTPGGTQLVKDIIPGSGGSGIGGIVIAENGTAYFVVRDGTNQSQLWKSDGSTAGTVRVKDFSAAGFGPVSQLTAASSGAFFVMRDPVNGDELWKSDGTEIGTGLVEDINPGVAGSVISALTYVGGGKVMFGAVVAGAGVEPWVSDGTNPGTFTLGDLNPAAASTFPEQFTPISAGVLFISNALVTATSSHGLWITDGTAAGTVRVDDHFQSDLPSGSSSVRAANLTRVGTNTAFFTLSNSNYERLWKTNGTAVGTGFVANIRENFSSPFTARELTDVNGTLYFAAAGSQAVGFEPWKSDGTAGGTGVLADIAPGALYSNPEEFTFANGRVYFSADNNTNGLEVFSTDGSGPGTSMAKDIYIGPESSLASSFVVLSGQIYFTARDQTNGSSIWTSNGTPAGTTIAVDLPGPSQSSNPAFIGRATDGDVFFSVEDFNTGYLNLWRTDGTSNGTIQLFTGSAFLDVRNAAVAGDKVFFVGTDPVNNTELWVSDGSVAGTHLLADLYPSGSSAPTSLTAVGNQLYFNAADGQGADRDIWRTNGAPGGTVKIADGLSGTDFIEFSGFVYFRNGNSLWRTDGTTASQFGTFVSTVPMAVSNGGLYFAGFDSTFGGEIWRSDGTIGGTAIVKDLVTGTASSVPRLIKPFGNGVVFIAYDNVGNLSVYKSDGTNPGTFVLGSTGSEFDLGWDTIHVAGNKVFFLADDATHGIELWVSNGAANDAQLVKDIKPNSGDSRIESMVVGTDRRLYFGADEGANGRELWSSDGTLAGTRLEQDINPGAASSDPDSFLAAPNGSIYFSADDGVHGSEPWLFTPEVAFASIVNRVLIVNGTSASDALSLTFDASSVTANRNGSMLSFARNDFDFIQVNADAGDDTLTINAPGAISQSLTFIGGAGTNTLSVQSGAITLANDVGALNSSVAVNVATGASLTMTTTQHMASLAVSGNATMPANGNRVLVTQALSITGSASLDLNDNDLVLDYTGPTQRAAIQALINAARSGGTWLGAGLTSTAARNASPKNKTLGALEASEFKSVYGAGAQFAGETIDSTAILVKYTYYGDSDFNGVVDFDDYSRIDSGFLNHRSGWLNGDFDGNGVVDFDDYSLIDFAFNTRGSALRHGPPANGGKPGEGGGVAAR